MTALLGLVPVAVAALGWYGLHRLNRRKRWFRIGEVIFWDAILLVLVYLVWLHDGPFGDSSAIPTYLLSELTRSQVTVALNGDGGTQVVP